MKKTLKEKEKHLNELFFDYYSEQEAVENFVYLTSKNRQKRTTENHIRNCFERRELGSLLRRLDPIAFNCYCF